VTTFVPQPVHNVGTYDNLLQLGKSPTASSTTEAAYSPISSASRKIEPLRAVLSPLPYMTEPDTNSIPLEQPIIPPRPAIACNSVAQSTIDSLKLHLAQQNTFEEFTTNSDFPSITITASVIQPPPQQVLVDLAQPNSSHPLKTMPSMESPIVTPEAVIADLYSIFREEISQGKLLNEQERRQYGFQTFTVTYYNDPQPASKESFCIRPQYLFSTFVQGFPLQTDKLPLEIREKFNTLFFEVMSEINKSHPTLYARLIRVEMLPNNRLATSEFLKARVLFALGVKAIETPKIDARESLVEEDTFSCQGCLNALFCSPSTESRAKTN
jgi:hypothetical protein